MANIQGKINNAPIKTLYILFSTRRTVSSQFAAATHVHSIQATAAGINSEQRRCQEGTLEKARA